MSAADAPTSGGGGVVVSAEEFARVQSELDRAPEAVPELLDLARRRRNA